MDIRGDGGSLNADELQYHVGQNVGRANPGFRRGFTSHWSRISRHRRQRGRQKIQIKPVGELSPIEAALSEDGDSQKVGDSGTGAVGIDHSGIIEHRLLFLK
jgi:hypothetical protein